MLRIYIVAAIVSTIIGTLNSQNNTSDYRQKVLEDVMNHLIMSTGRVLSDPEIKLIGTENNVASFSSNNIIKFEKRAYRICQEFGEDSLNAIAYLIAHELGHKINKDYNSLHTCSFYADASFKSDDDATKSTNKIIKTQRRIEIEHNADQTACLFTQIAGYNSIPIVEELLKKIYKEYDFSKKMKNYPSLEQRIGISKKAIDKSEKELVPLFNAANIAFLIGDYECAASGFKKLIDEFPSREMFSNLGSCYASHAIKLINEDSSTLIYPFEIDADTRLEIMEGTRGVDFSNDVTKNKEIESLIKKANKNFKKSTQKDIDYFNGFLFRSLCFHLLKQDGDAEYFLKTKAKKSMKSKNDSLLYQLTELIMNFNEELDTNITIAKLNAIDHPISKYNIAKLEGKENISSNNTITYTKEDSFNMDYDTPRINLPNDITFRYTTTKNDNFYEISDLYESLWIHEVKNIKTNKVDGISKNNSKKEIITALGNPNRVIANYDKTYLIYAESNLIIVLDKNELYSSYIYYDSY